MQCTRPMYAVRVLDETTGAGRHPILFDSQQVSYLRQQIDVKGLDPKKLALLYKRELVKLPCGKCPSCVANRARDWSIRAYHESQLYKHNVFLTLTYNDEHLPDIYPDTSNRGRSPKEDFQRFMKLFRKNILNTVNDRIRYFHVFEYGTNFSRPHHHVIVFNCELKDKKLWQMKNHFPIYRSEIVEKSWQYFPEKNKPGESYGFSTVQDVNYAVCAYVARYCMKKVDVDADWYDGRQPEFNLMSRRPGLGHDWFTKFHFDVYPVDLLVMKDFVSRPPKYYDYLYDMQDSSGMEVIKNARKEYAIDHQAEITAQRQRDIEKYQFEKILRMKRDFEKGEL